MDATATYRTGPVLVARDTGDDPFHDPLMLGIGIAVVVVTLVILAIGGLYYWGTLYGTPSWGSHSFPAPSIY